MRIFTAIEIPEDIKSEVISLCGGVKNIRWVSKENLHITLNFIGEIENNEVEKIDSVLKNIEINKFKLVLSGSGFFKSGALWIGVEKSNELLRLERECCKNLLEAGIDLDVRKYKPHLTVGRFKKVDINEFLGNTMGYKSRKFRVEGVSLYSSILKQSGAIYTKLSSY